MTSASDGAPRGWEPCRLDRVLKYRKRQITPAQLRGMRVFHYSIPVVAETGDGQLEDGEEIDSNKFVVQGDEVLISKLNPHKGHLVLTRPQELLAVCSTEFLPLAPQHGERRFFYYLYASQPIREQIIAACQSATRSHMRARPEDIWKLIVSLPPPATQRAIADFLDRKTQAIDELIRNKERLIELLQEKRQALITQAVTKGLDLNVPMKDSGLPWLGKIPAHWDVKLLMHLTPPTRRIMYGIVLPGPDVEGGIPIVKGGDVKRERLKLESLSRTAPEIEIRYVRSRLASGDLVFAIRGGVGDVEMVPPDLEGANLTQDAARVAPSSAVDAHWLLLFLRSHIAFSQVEPRILGATVRGINIRDLKRVIVPTPPHAEQSRISEVVGRRCDALVSIQERLTTQIDRIREYRQALISAAVTGQLDATVMKPAGACLR
ncbi:MAG: restriction endonuclease subunit S [Hyphomicrobium sp.]